MNELDLLNNVVSKYGIQGLIILFLLWDKVLKPMHKKSKGEWINYSTLDKDITKVNVKLHELEKWIDKELNHNFNQHNEIFSKLDKLEDNVK